MDTSILPRIKRCLAQVLAVDEGEIEETHRLIDDLGADSLDLVELMFALEQEFNIRLSREDMNLSAQLGLPEHEIHNNEVLTDRALVRLRELFPNARDFFQAGITRRHLAALLTVAEVARTVQRKLVAAFKP